MKLPPLLSVALVAKALALGLWFFAAAPRGAAVCFFGLDPLILYGMFAPSGGTLGRVYTRFQTDQREVWLTIDDGPDANDTPQILDLLERHGARATFFVIGDRAARHPGLIAEIQRRGHEVAHHTHTHPTASFWCASPQRLRGELDHALNAVAAGGARPRWFRAPVGIKHLLLGPQLTARGLHYVGWSIRSGDSFARTPEAVADAVMQRVRPGAIVLLHEGPSVPAEVRVRGIALVLERLAAAKFACVLPTPAQLR